MQEDKILKYRDLDKEWNFPSKDNHFISEGDWILEVTSQGEEVRRINKLYIIEIVWEFLGKLPMEYPLPPLIPDSRDSSALPYSGTEPLRVSGIPLDKEGIEL